MSIILIDRRVHITAETLQHLNGAYQVEEGNGGSRDALLDGRNTFLVIDPRKPDGVSKRPKLVGGLQRLFQMCGYVLYLWSFQNSKIIF